jgi:hypothetical protein
MKRCYGSYVKGLNEPAIFTGIDLIKLHFAAYFVLQMLSNLGAYINTIGRQEQWAVTFYRAL